MKRDDYDRWAAQLDEDIDAAAPDVEPDHHRNAPRPDTACLYGLVGEVALAGSENTEANPYAIALNFMAYLCAAVGRGPFTTVGNTWHHPRLFTLQVGRTGRGRKGDAVSLVHRIDMAIRAGDEYVAPQVHTGGLSTREGLALMIHDGWTVGKTEVEPIHDKRLWVPESEFVNVLHQGKREGNTLSSALRDAWDGVSIKPATKGQPRVWASNPHINLSAAITPGELLEVMAARELTNGFANRFLTVWAERTRKLAYPKATPQAEVDRLAAKCMEVIRFAGGDRPVERDVHEITMSAAAVRMYERLYHGELTEDVAGERITALLERRAPVLRRLAMLFALSDLRREVDVQHIEAALAWIRYWSDSVRFIFSSAAEEAAKIEVNDTARKIVEYLSQRQKASRKELIVGCFKGHISKSRLDDAIDELLLASPPQIVTESVPRPATSPGSPTKFYRLAANPANPANREHRRGAPVDSRPCEPCEPCEPSYAPEADATTSVRTVRTVRKQSNQAQTRANIDGSHSSHSSQGEAASPSPEEF